MEQKKQTLKNKKEILGTWAMNGLYNNESMNMLRSIHFMYTQNQKCLYKLSAN